MALTILTLSFFLLLILGVPVAFSIGLCSLITVAYEGLPVAVVFQKMVGGMQVFSFLAIPFFILSGELMLYGGIADRIVNFAKALVGHVRGGLGMTNVVACTLFGGISGSAVADVSAMGAVLIPVMKREGYDADYAVNVTTHAALVGVLMPTSLNIIIFTLAAGGSASVFDMILAGIIPGVLLTVCNLIAAYWVAVKRGYPTGAWQGWGAVWTTFVKAMPGLFVVIIILAGIVSGVFTATEAASISVLYSLLLTGLVYRSLSWDNFIAALAKSVKTTGIVLLLIGISAAFGYFMAFYEVPDIMGEWMASVSAEPWIVFLMVNVMLFILGTFLDMAPTILVCTPIFMPICEKFGMDPIQFGIVMLLNCALGLNTPPVGTTQFVGCAIGEISVGQVMRTIWPFYGSLVITMLVITYIPALSLWLPHLAKGM
ncbi:TRAP transporter large permease [Uliginosibacterium sp. 31-16]|uniref:TRAP transporter large permease n=1 Tax=Uliginosibacterium sp. 31-16 TaxID=3068315 RepID=UPI00273FC97E|nr:TRAP transporter large permease [Uliginosibacterium sp. 31-16]MDP5238138.1 TRAP transporter large permease [Uliginosibacterium sp. 31-16]